MESACSASSWLAGEKRQVLARVVAAHDRIVAKGANQAPFLSVMGTTVDMVMNAISERKPDTQSCQVNVAIKIHPLAAILGPRSTTKSLADASLNYGLLYRPEVFAGHNRTKPNYVSRESSVYLPNLGG